MARRTIDGAVVITGASSGIGRATARAFAERGAKVVLAARSRSSLEEAAEECRAAGGEALVVPTDVADEEAVEDLGRAALDAFGSIGVWVSNAGVMAFGPFDEVPADVHRKVLETNLFGVIHGARVAVPLFRRQGHGTLVNVASLYGEITSPFVSAYATSKFGVMGFSRVLREELRELPDVHVCVVIPSTIDTPIFRHAGNYTGRAISPLPPVSDPRRVVRAIVGCVDHPRREVHVGRTQQLASWANAAFPRTYDRLVLPTMRTVALREGPAPPSPGNVLTPEPELNRVDGGFRSWRPKAVIGAGGATAGVVLALLRRRGSSG